MARKCVWKSTTKSYESIVTLRASEPCESWQRGVRAMRAMTVSHASQRGEPQSRSQSLRCEEYYYLRGVIMS